MTREQLDALLDRVRSWPSERQDEAAACCSRWKLTEMRSSPVAEQEARTRGALRGD